MGCTTSTPYKDYYLGLERKKRDRCNCQCHKNGLGVAVDSMGQYQPIGKSESESFKGDPRIPLTGRQIFIIKRSWKGISRNMCETGINMFLSLFEKNEEVLGFFQGLRSAKTLTELRTSKVLVNHVKGVMLTIDEAITNLDDAGTIIDMLLFVGKSHTRFKGFDPNVFMLIKDSFLLAVRDTLGDRYTAHVEDIYQTTIHFILTTLIAGFGGSPTEKEQTAAAKAASPGQQRSGGLYRVVEEAATSPRQQAGSGGGTGYGSGDKVKATAYSPKPGASWMASRTPDTMRQVSPTPGTSWEE